MMTAARVLVVGSINADITFEVAHLPAAGATIVADAVRRASGGKGANQAYAAARTAQGVRVLMAGAVGDDGVGAIMRGELADAGVETSLIREVNGPSGMAMIAVDAAGANLIVVAPGANHDWPDEPAPEIEPRDVVVLQLELPLDVVTRVAEAARAAGARVILNAAPVTPGAAHLLPLLDTLVVNEGEAAELLGLSDLDDARVGAAAAGHDLDLVITLGAEGAIVATRDGAVSRIPALTVETVDTVGAGDAFVGALAVALAAGADLPDAARRGAVAGALTVTVRGARHPDLSAALIDHALTATVPDDSAPDDTAPDDTAPDDTLPRRTSSEPE